MNNRVYLSDAELLMGQVAALIESPFEPSEDYVERYKRVTNMSLDQDTINNLNHHTPEQQRHKSPQDNPVAAHLMCCCEDFWGPGWFSEGSS